MPEQKRIYCSDCKRPRNVCYCHIIKQVDNAWPVYILQHPAEQKHAIGTARIAALSLSNSTLYNGDNFTDDELSSILPHQSAPILVYPGEDSQSVLDISDQAPRPLVFIDASWRKSRRMLQESPSLMALPKVSFSPEKASDYRIRKVPDINALSTLEAIVYVLSRLDKTESKYQTLLDTMKWMIDKQIECMGEAVYRKNYRKND